MVELINNDHQVKVICRQPIDAIGREALDARENMSPSLRASAAHESLAKSTVGHRLAEGLEQPVRRELEDLGRACR